MSGTERDVERAREEAMRARARLADTMGEIQDRLNPRNLINDAWQEVRERGHDIADQAVHLARAKPLATSAVAATAIALLAREPIWRALGTLIFRRRGTSATDERLETEAEPAPPAKSSVVRHGYEEVA